MAIYQTGVRVLRTGQVEPQRDNTMIQGRKLEASCAELPNLRLHAGPYHVVVYQQRRETKNR
jgi:hypothetical protein